MAITINGTGTITGISAGGLPDGSVTAADIESSLDLTGKTVTLPSGTGGKILQVVSTTKTDTFTTAASTSSPAAVTGLSATITPSSTSSKILVLVNIGAAGCTGNDYPVFIFLAKGGTIISGAKGDTAGNRTSCAGSSNLTATYNHAPLSFSYQDSPASTSSLTYQVYCSSYNSATAAINRSGYDADNSAYCRAISTITVMEVAG